MKTVNDIAEEMMRYPETDILEVLEISSEDLVNRFMDKIVDKYDYLSEEFEEVDEDEDFYS